ncbi:hypothetical protein HDV00_006876, partial [Rhizophlyctis rosea]
MGKKEPSLAEKAAAGAASGDEVRLQTNTTKEKPSSDPPSPPASPDPPAPPPSPQILNSSLTASMKEALSHRYFRATGFQTCSMLNNATFDSFVDVKPLGGSVVEKNPTMEEFVELIDERADAVVDWLKAAINNHDALRYACFISAEGTSHYLNMTDHPLMVGIDPLHYFKENIPSIAPSPSKFPGERRKYKLAYLFLVHEVLGAPQLEMLIDILDDGNALILIHVDARSQQLHNNLDQYIKKREFQKGQRVGRGNVHLAQKRFPCIWGHSSLVLAQLSGFWELRDLAEWEYVINLSNFDWPLVRNGRILEVLNGMGRRNWIEYWVDTKHLAERIGRPHMATLNNERAHHHKELGVVNRPFPSWTLYKHHQWMILTAEAVDFFRTDPDALLFLAFSESVYIPDEMYFATVLLNSLKFKDTVINDSKRYLRWPHFGSPHPAWLGLTDRIHFPPQPPPLTLHPSLANATNITIVPSHTVKTPPPYQTPPHFFARKINAVGDNGPNNPRKEKALLEWIRVNLLDFEEGKTGCDARGDMAGWRDGCLEDLLVRETMGGEMTPLEKPLKPSAALVTAQTGDPLSASVVLIPVTQSTLNLGLNLACSVEANFQSMISSPVVFWSLDLEVHEKLMERGRKSLYHYTVNEADRTLGDGE